MKKTSAKKDDANAPLRSSLGLNDDHDAPRIEPTEKSPTAGRVREGILAPADAAQAADTIEQLEAKVVSLEDSLLRAKADYQNLQRRTGMEQAEAIRYANADLMKSLLSVLDDFERSLATAQEGDNLSAVVDGVRLVYDNLMKALRDHGLSTIEALHRPFDPTVHEAMMQQPSADHPTETVVEEIAKGYRLRDRVIRPARVIVSKATEEKPAEAETAGDPEHGDQA